MSGKKRRSSIEAIQCMVKDAHQSPAEHARERRLSLNMMNCIWARNTDVETSEPVAGCITGEWPRWLEGTMYRVGPGIIQVGDSCYKHPFDMLSVIHKYTLSSDKNKCSYQNKIVDSEVRTQMELKQRGWNPSELGKGKLHKLTKIFTRPKFGSNEHCSIQDNCIDNVFFFGGRKFYNSSPSLQVHNLTLANTLKKAEDTDDREMYIMSDIPHMLRIDPNNLETLYKFDIDEHTPVSYFSAHPQIEEDGTLWNIGTACSKSQGYYYSIIKFKPEEKKNLDYCVGNQFGSNLTDNAIEVARIPARMSGSPSYIHSFGMSKHFIIFIEQPLFLDEDHVKIGCTSSESSSEKVPLEYPHRQNYTWKRGEMVHLHVIDKNGGEVLNTLYQCQPFFFFHTINAFEKSKYMPPSETSHRSNKEPDSIVLDLITYKDSEILNELKFSRIERTDRVPPGNAVRIQLPLRRNQDNETVTVKTEILVPEAMEFPRIDYRSMGQEYSFFYALGNDYLHPNKIYKVDLTTRDVMVWKEPGQFVSEPIFVPRTISLYNDNFSNNGDCNTQSDGQPCIKKFAEDDGVVIFTLLSSALQKYVQVVVVDAENFSELARMQFRAEGVVTQSFHGIFVPENSEIFPRY